jgi:hypothetical protein
LHSKKRKHKVEDKPLKHKTLILVIILLGITIAGGSFAVDLNKERNKLQASSAENQKEGYWASNTFVTYTRVNGYPTGKVYYFSLDADSASTQGAVDIPLWKHWGTKAAYSISVTDTGAGLLTDGDSLFTEILVRGMNANLEVGTAVTLNDSGNNQATVKITALNTALIVGEIDIDTLVYGWERMKLTCTQSLVDAQNTATLQVLLMVSLPFSTEYLESPYFIREETEN